MQQRPLQILVAIAVLATAMLAGWFATNSLQQRVSLRSDLVGCWRLGGTVDQTRCVSDRFMDGADDAAGTRSGLDRDRLVVEYVARQEDAAADSARLAGICHPAMHELGRREGSRAAGEGRVPTFPGGSSQLCTAGYVHGLAEGYLVGTPDADVAAVFPKLCHDADSRDGCAHGVGHALLRAHADDAATPATTAAVDRCGELPRDFPTNCYNGVYMELAMRTEPAIVSSTAFVEACRATGDDADKSLACWGYLSLSLTTNDVPTSQVPTWCAKASLPGQYSCIEQHGRDLGIERVTSCETIEGSTNLRRRCIDGAVALTVGSGHVEEDRARDYCGELKRSAMRSHCDDAVDRYLRGRAQLVGDA